MIYCDTIYRLDDKKFSTGFYAKDIYHAKELIDIRNIGESIQGLPEDVNKNFKDKVDRPYILLSLADIPYKRLYHCLSFLCWIGVRSGRLDIDDVLGDEKGIIHLLSHHIQLKGTCDDPGIDLLIKRSKVVENSVSEFWKQLVYA